MKGKNLLKMSKVQILMSTYNGEKYLKEQIDSIIKQEGVELELLVRDDGSKDSTIDIIKEFTNQYKNIKFYQGENLGAARSFMDLLNKSDEHYDYYAFADQDDVWMPDKIISAIKKLEEYKDKLALYMSALEIVDEELNFIEIKKVEGNFSFEGEMIKNFATGCTMVLNKKLVDIIKEYNPNYLIMHDSWITRVCYAIGGNVIIDEKSHIKYRQHGDNVLGYKDEGLQKIKRQLKIAFKDNVCMRVNIAKELKNGYEKKLTDNARGVVENLINYTKDRKAKKWLLHNKSFRTTNKKLNLKMKLGILLNKF